MAKQFKTTEADSLIDNIVSGSTPTTKKVTRRRKATNHKAKKTNAAAELRSQRKQILVTPETGKQLNLVARIKGVSQNEIVNEAIESYLKKTMRDATIKELVSKLG